MDKTQTKPESPPDFHHVTVLAHYFQRMRVERNPQKNIKTIMHVTTNSLEETQALIAILQKQVDEFRDGMNFPTFDIIGEFTRVE